MAVLIFGETPAPASEARGFPAVYSRSGYLEMACGHYTDRESDLLYSAWQPSRYQHWCEKCGAWKTAKRRKKTVYPQEPLF